MGPWANAVTWSFAPQMGRATKNRPQHRQLGPIGLWQGGGKPQRHGRPDPPPRPLSSLAIIALQNISRLCGRYLLPVERGCRHRRTNRAPMDGLEKTLVVAAEAVVLLARGR